MGNTPSQLETATTDVQQILGLEVPLVRPTLDRLLSTVSANNVTTQAFLNLDDFTPQTEFGMVAKSFLSHYVKNPSATGIATDSCQSAEPKFLLSLATALKSDNTKDDKRAPAQVIIDEDGRLAGYTKHFGYATTLVLGKIPGHEELPLGSIIDLRGATDDFPMYVSQNSHFEVRLIPAKAKGMRIDLDRPSIFSFDPMYRAILGYLPRQEASRFYLDSFVQQVGVIGLSSIVTQVEALAEACNF